MLSKSRAALAGLASVAAVAGGSLALAAIPGVVSAEPEVVPTRVAATAAATATEAERSLEIWAREQLAQANADLDAARALRIAINSGDQTTIDIAGPTTSSTTLPVQSLGTPTAAPQPNEPAGAGTPKAPAPTADASTGGSGGAYSDDDDEYDDDEYDDEYDDDDDDDDEYDDDDRDDDDD